MVNQAYLSLWQKIEAFPPDQEMATVPFSAKLAAALCKGTLNRELHHYPSAGGEQEDVKHRVWYAETLALYRSVFGAEAPADADHDRG